MALENSLCEACCNFTLAESERSAVSYYNEGGKCGNFRWESKEVHGSLVRILAGRMTCLPLIDSN